MPLIPVLLAATVAGSLLAPFYSLAQTSGWVSFCGSLLLALCCRQRPAPFLIACLLAFFLLANLRYPLQFRVDSAVDQIDQRARKVTVTADLISVRPLVGERSQLDLQIVALADGGEAIDVSTPFLLRLYLGSEVSKLLPGDRLRFKTRLRRPRLFGTPGEFHWPRYLASQDIAMTGWLQSTDDISVVSSRDTYPSRFIAAWKHRAADAIDAALEDRRGVLVRALVLGEARMLPDALRDTLAQAGISHLFAISGLHLGLLAMLGYRLLLVFYRRSATLLNWQPPQRVLPLLLLPVLLGYLLLTGDAVSTRRAFCLAVLGVGLCLWRYNVNPLRLLMSLALLFLLCNPLLLWQPAWQLSFAGAAGILLWRPLWQGRVATFPLLIRGPLQLLIVPLAATLATLPFVLASFHLFAPAGVLANLLAVPIVAFLALPAGLFSLVFLDLPLIGDLFLSCSGFLLEMTVYLVERLLSFSGFSGHYLFLSRWQYLAVGLLLLPVVLAVQPASKKHRQYFSVVCLLMALFCFFMPVFGAGGLSLYMFSVGQGESLLLTDAAHRAVLIDGGGLYSDRFDVGERLLAPALGELGVQRLSAVLLTHDHPDHRKGLIFILRQFPVDEFWSGIEFADLHPTLQQVLSEKSIPVRRLPTGWSDVDPRKHDSIKLFRGVEQGDKNDDSLVLYLPAQGGGLLLTGDLEKKGVDGLLAAGLPGPVSVLKLPHHGSRHSEAERLIGRLQPELCLASAGFQNRYGFPARQLVTYLDRKFIPLYRTDIMGTVRVRYLADQWRVARWQNGLFH